MSSGFKVVSHSSYSSDSLHNWNNSVGGVLAICHCSLARVSPEFLWPVAFPECLAWESLLLLKLGFLWAQFFTRTHSSLTAGEIPVSLGKHSICTMGPQITHIQTLLFTQPMNALNICFSIGRLLSRQSVPFSVPAHWEHALATINESWPSFQFFPGWYWKWYFVLIYIDLTFKRLNFFI